MAFYIKYTKDVIGNNYLAIKINKSNIDKYLNDLEDRLDSDLFDEYTKNQQKRDNNSYHITVINVMEFNSLMSQLGIDKLTQYLELIFKYPIDDLKMLGLGQAEKSGNKSYFVVCESEKLNAVRQRFNLPEHDFHITIGFKHKDVFGVRKNKVLPKINNFLNLLGYEYLKNQSWDFIKDIDNYDFDTDEEIYPVEITESYIKFRLNDNYFDVSYIDSNDEFRIVTKYRSKDNLTRIPTTEINKIFSKK